MKLLPSEPACVCSTYQGLSLISGMGAHVKKTVTSRNVRLPHTSDSAPIRGADMNDSRPLRVHETSFHVNWPSGTSSCFARDSLIIDAFIQVDIHVPFQNVTFAERRNKVPAVDTFSVVSG